MRRLRLVRAITCAPIVRVLRVGVRLIERAVVPPVHAEREMREDGGAQTRPGEGIATRLAKNEVIVGERAAAEERFIEEIMVSALLFEGHRPIRRAAAPAIHPPHQPARASHTHRPSGGTVSGQRRGKAPRERAGTVLRIKRPRPWLPDPRSVAEPRPPCQGGGAEGSVSV